MHELVMSSVHVKEDIRCTLTIAVCHLWLPPILQTVAHCYSALHSTRYSGIVEAREDIQSLAVPSLLLSLKVPSCISFQTSDTRCLQKGSQKNKNKSLFKKDGHWSEREVVFLKRAQYIYINKNVKCSFVQNLKSPKALH